MPRKKDMALILALLGGALIIYLISRVLPGSSVESRTADVTLAPDAIEVLDAQTAVPDPPATLEGAPVPGPETAEDTPVPEASSEPEAIVGAVPETTTEPAGPEAEKASEPKTVPAGPLFGPNLAAETEPVRGHVVINVGGRQYGDPIPMDRDKIITIRQDAHTINRIHITRESVYMESSTCDNQDCVGEGEVTLENYRQRILGPYIVCLPNGVTVEMIPLDTTEAQK